MAVEITPLHWHIARWLICFNSRWHNRCLLCKLVEGVTLTTCSTFVWLCVYGNAEKTLVVHKAFHVHKDLQICLHIHACAFYCLTMCALCLLQMCYCCVLPIYTNVCACGLIFLTRLRNNFVFEWFSCIIPCITLWLWKLVLIENFALGWLCWVGFGRGSNRREERGNDKIQVKDFFSSGKCHKDIGIRDVIFIISSKRVIEWDRRTHLASSVST